MSVRSRAAEVRTVVLPAQKRRELLPFDGPRRVLYDPCVRMARPKHVALDENPCEHTGYYPIHAVVANRRADMFDFLVTQHAAPLVQAAYRHRARARDDGCQHRGHCG